MKNRCVLQVAFVLSMLVSPNAQDVIGPDYSCARSNPAEGHTRVTFLLEDAAGARSLYITMWSEDKRLVTCEINSNPMVAERYATLCDRSDTRGPEITQKFNISTLLAPDTPCVIVSSSVPKRSRSTRGDGTERKTRRKRAWILPGTLWCGSGSKAFEYEQLGMFESADRCCREHDHCLHTIPAFTLNYGVFNSNFFTVSHCECDQRFRQCLLDVDESISTMVGYSFFNILQVPCFELKLQKRCTEMYWWGMCRVAEEAPYAVFKKALPYNTSDFTHIYSDTDSNKLTSSEGQHVTKSPMITLYTKSVKTKQRCGFRDPPRRETFHRRNTKKRGCKRHQKLFGEGPSQAPPMSRGNTTYLSMTTGLLNASKSSILISTKRRAGKKKGIRKGLSDYPTHKGHFPPQVNTNSDPQTSSMTPPSTLPLTQRPKLQLHPTRAVTAVTKTMRSPKKVPKQSRCCRSRQPVRGDTFQPHCKNCMGQEAGSHMTAVTPAKTNGLPIKLTTHETMHLKKTTEKPKEDSLLSLWNTATFATPIITKLKTIASKSQKQVDSYLLWNNTSQEPMAITIDQSSHAESVKQKNALCKMTDYQLLCGSLKHLDGCKFKIPPLEKKYNLQNEETKTTYHCDCTSRMAVHIESFKQPSIIPSLLVDFVSQQCFTLPKEKKCHRKKSCSGSFTQASDLHQALKKIEEKDTAEVGISGNARKRGIPVRLYKRCLRLGRVADDMARLR